MARDGAFFAAAARLHPRWNSPWIAVLAQGVCCCLLILTGTFQSLINYIGFTLYLFSSLSVLALFKFRRRPDWKRSPWVSLAYPLIPLAYVAMNAWVVYFSWNRAALWSVATIVAGALIYHLYIRQRPRMVESAIKN